MITLLDKRDKSEKKFRIIKNIKFTTVRRQQSMVLYDMQTERIIVFTKGADSSIFPQARSDQIEVK